MAGLLFLPLWCPWSFYWVIPFGRVASLKCPVINHSPDPHSPPNTKSLLFPFAAPALKKWNWDCCPYFSSCAFLQTLEFYLQHSTITVLSKSQGPPSYQTHWFFLCYFTWPQFFFFLFLFLPQFLSDLTQLTIPLFEMRNFSKFSVTPSFMDFSLISEAVLCSQSHVLASIFFCFTYKHGCVPRLYPGLALLLHLYILLRNDLVQFHGMKYHLKSTFLALSPRTSDLYIQL